VVCVYGRRGNHNGSLCGVPEVARRLQAMCTQANAEGDFTLIQWPQHFWSPKPQTVITMRR